MTDHELTSTVRRIVCSLHGEGLASSAAITQLIATAKEYARTAPPPPPGARSIEALGESIEELRGVRESFQAQAVALAGGCG